MKEIALVYMVAGMSSRFGGKIKCLAPVGPEDETLLEYSFKQALPAGFTKIILIVSEKTKQPIQEKFGNSYNNIPIIYATQEFDYEKRDKPWGTNDALCSAKNLINCPFVVANGDDIYGENSFRILFNHLEKETECATIGYKLENVLPEKGSVNRGVFQTNSQEEVEAIKEHLDISKENFLEKGLSLISLCSMNLFALTPQTLNFLNELLIEFKNKHKEDRKIECFLPEKLGELIKQNKIKMKLYATDDICFGITNPEDEKILKTKIKNIK